MSTEVTLTKVSVSHQTLKILFSAGLYDHVSAMSDHTFTASNDIIIKCDNGYIPGYDGEKLKLDDRYRGKVYLLKDVANVDKLIAALAELADNPFGIDSSWTVIGSLGKPSEEPLGLAFHKSTSTVERYKLFMPESIYNWVDLRGRFKASNGIKIRCNASHSPGFQNGGKNTLFLDDRFKGKVGLIDSQFGNLSIFETRVEEISVALKELHEADKKPAPAAVKIHVSEPAYKFAGNDGFTASNGIIIKCHDHFSPGFGNGSKDTLFLDDRYKGREVKISAHDFKKIHNLYDRAAEITAALAELEEKAKTTPAPVPIKIQVSKRAYRFAGDNGFTASNGIIIKCHNQFTPGFENGGKDTVYLDDRFMGEGTEISSANFERFDKFSSRREQVTVALAELEKKTEAIPTAPAPAPTPASIKIHVSKRAYRFAKGDGFTASNGLVIKCANRFMPGFENPVSNTVYLDDRFMKEGAEISSTNFEKFDQFSSRREQFTVALAELEKKAEDAPEKSAEEEQPEIPRDLLFMLLACDLLGRK